MTELYKQAQSRIPATISLPSRWLKSYENFVANNASSVTQMESALRSLTYIIPGRFRESELASETLHTSTLLLSLYHTSLLRRHFPSPSPPSPQTRYTAFYTARSRLYSHSAVLLQTIQYTELLCEMFFKRRGGDKARWRLVVVLEVIKAVCRTIMFWVTGRRMVIEGVGAERPNIPESSSTTSVEEMIEGEDVVSAGGHDEERRAHEERSKAWVMPRTGMTLPVLPATSPASITSFLSSRVISAEDIKAAHHLVRKISSLQGQVAEMMWILRPVVYALAMQKLQGGRNRRDWRPWLLGLGMEVAARELGKKEVRERRVGGWRGMTGVEREEMKRRGWGLAWWGMRGAFYENITRSWIQGFAGKLKGKPLLDIVDGILEDYDYLWDEYYFSTSTM
ncbi:MAG: hypothetical protein LQ338_005916 [Usnochroma carphineum]|nr:MAG: hypothetical protein LQ338_005916 [Usnochroma carphineum]